MQYPETCGKFAVKSVRDLTTGYDSAQPDGKAVSMCVVIYQFLTVLSAFRYMLKCIYMYSVRQKLLYAWKLKMRWY